MRYLPFIFRNLFRKKTRTILTIGSIAVALFLFGLLVDHRDRPQRRRRCGRRRPAGGAQQDLADHAAALWPIRSGCARSTTSTEATFATWFGGVYQDQKNFFPQFADRHRNLPRGLPGVRDPRRPVAGLPRRPRGRRGRQGDRRTLRLEGRAIGSRSRARSGPAPGSSTSAPSTRARRRATTSRSSGSSGSTSRNGVRHLRRRDGRLVHGPDRRSRQRGGGQPRPSTNDSPTRRGRPRPKPKQAFAAGFAKQIGNIKMLMLSIGAVVFFTLLLVTGNTMAMAVRERVPELGVLKTLGFGDKTVLFMVLAESLVIAAGRRRHRARSRQALHHGRRSHRRHAAAVLISRPATASRLGDRPHRRPRGRVDPGDDGEELRIVDALRRV